MLLLLLLRWNSFATQFYFILFPAASEPSMNFDNSKLTYFLPFVCVLESKVPIGWVSNPTSRSETAMLRSNVFKFFDKFEVFLIEWIFTMFSMGRCRIKMHLKGKLRDTRNPFVVLFEFVLDGASFKNSYQMMQEFDVL